MPFFNIYVDQAVGKRGEGLGGEGSSGNIFHFLKCLTTSVSGGEGGRQKERGRGGMERLKLLARGEGGGGSGGGRCQWGRLGGGERKGRF